MALQLPNLEENIEPHTLYVVATPIGNLADITLRALYILENVDLIACEDTRRTAQLLRFYDIDKPLISFHSHSGESRFLEIKNQLEIGTVALVSDAGTPCISDPGAELAAYLLESGFAIRPIPGPSAVITALSASGLDTREFTFRGFLGKKGLKNKISQLMKLRETQIVYEAPQRLVELLRLITEVDPERPITVARELTKLYEEFYRGSAKDAVSYFEQKGVKGEITLIIAGNTTNNIYSDEDILELLKESLANGKSLSEASKEVASKTGLTKKIVYSLGLSMDKA